MDGLPDGGRVAGGGGPAEGGGLADPGGLTGAVGLCDGDGLAEVDGLPDGVGLSEADGVPAEATADGDGSAPAVPVVGPARGWDDAGAGATADGG